MNKHTDDCGAHENGAQSALHQQAANRWVHTIGGAEGVSFLLLLFVAMPFKYIGHNPKLVEWLGPVHGGLFLFYVASAFGVARVLKWRWYHLALALFSSVVPFGPFVFRAWMKRVNGA